MIEANPAEEAAVGGYMQPRNVIIIGAAGRDFHDFNVVFRDKPEFRVAAFTATQIPEIDGRSYPPELAGPLYPQGIPIEPMDDLEKLIRAHKVDVCYFCYSDASYNSVMQLGARVLSAGAEFGFLPPGGSMLKSSKPVISTVAVRTGCGKSQTTRYIAAILKKLGKRAAVVRHPMPYGNLVEQRVQKYETLEDLKRYKCTIEEMEEYEPHINEGNVLFAGVDYGDILREAEKCADVVLWDGGNNDATFYKSDLMITVADPLRVGNELTYYPSEFNLKAADVIIVNKVDTSGPEPVAKITENVKSRNPGAEIILCNSPVDTETPELIKGKRVLLVEDGPTVTHGEMAYGAAYLAAKKYGAASIVDPRPHARGSIAESFKKFTHLKEVLPALGYFPKQLQELEDTIAAVDCDTVVIGTPIDLRRVIAIKQPAARVTYRLEEREAGKLEAAVKKALGM
jgi:predicted GTPase